MPEGRACASADRQETQKQTRLQICPTNLWPRCKAIQWRPVSKRSSLNNWVSVCKNLNLGLKLRPYTKTNSKWITDLHVKQKAISLRKKENLQNLGLGRVLRLGTMHKRQNQYTAWVLRTECLCALPNSYVEPCPVLWGGAFGQWLGLDEVKGGTLMNESCAF